MANSQSCSSPPKGEVFFFCPGELVWAWHRSSNSRSKHFFSNIEYVTLLLAKYSEWHNVTQSVLCLLIESSLFLWPLKFQTENREQRLYLPDAGNCSLIRETRQTFSLNCFRAVTSIIFLPKVTSLYKNNKIGTNSWKIAFISNKTKN